MSSAGHILDVEGLGRLAQTLADGERRLNDQADSAPQIPDAGQSTAVVAALVSTITKAVSTIVETAAVASYQVTASEETYQQTDQHSAENLSHTGKVR
ncbi:MAG: hypothetical protein WCF33_02445 [Pseudonocardiaceae bacterium]